MALKGHFNEEHTVDVNAANIIFPLGGFVVWQHSRAIGRNVPILKEHGVKPIVLYRSFLDSLVSLEEKTAQRTDKNLRATFAAIYIPYWREWTQIERQKWVAYNVLPWYFSFYISWMEADIDKLFVRYDSFYKDEVAGIEKILDFVDPFLAPFPTKDIKKAVAHRDTSFNVGKSGRGQDLDGSVIDIAVKQARAWGPVWGPVLEKELW